MTMAGDIPFAERLDGLREELAEARLDAFIIPRADRFQGEYVPDHDQRLAWLTGFTGSAGWAVVLAGRAAVFVDGRYTLQVRQEVDTHLFTPVHLTDISLADWLADALSPGQRLGIDPWLHTPDQVDRLRTACNSAQAELVMLEQNPLDAIWTTDRPPPPQAPIIAHDLAFTGQSSTDKRAVLTGQLEKDRLDAVVLTDPSSVAWLLNIRGNDVEYTPQALCHACLHADGQVDLFVDAAKIGPATRAHLPDWVNILPADDFAAALDRLGRAQKRVRLDPALAAFAILDRLERAGARINRGADPCALPRACKNATELNGMRAAHRRDGAAMARFLHWLERQNSVDELTATSQLEDFRSLGDLFRGLSFATIAGSGPNGAIVHYRSGPASNRPLHPGDMFLLDSGAQYLDGTTDVTRTIFIAGPQGQAQPSPEQRQRFTLVLKGHIALARARFPVGTTGPQLDVLARRALWDHGLDFDHGTGHGVGSYLSVHEGPQRISKVGSGAVALRPGMVLSNEPGYYQEGAYGIRIENLMAVTEAATIDGGERAMMGFETLTLIPLDRRLMDIRLLDQDEQDWLDRYHARIRAEIGPFLDGGARDWLERATRPLNTF